MQCTDISRNARRGVRRGVQDRVSTSDASLPMSAESILELYEGTPTGNHARMWLLHSCADISKEDW
jgi:hypothetical protein